MKRISRLIRKIKKEARIRLNQDNSLQFVFSENLAFDRSELSVKAGIIAVEPDSLIAEVKVVALSGVSHIELIKFSGTWQADKYNQLCFEISKGGRPQVITFRGAWQVNKNQQIVYFAERTQLKTRIKYAQTLTFSGYWQILARERLVYVLSGSSKSRFEFRAQIESPSLRPKEGLIKYRLGIGTSQRKISLFGEWKISRALGLIFQVDYGRNGLHAIEFETDITLSGKDKIVFVLKNSKQEPLGLSLVYSRRILQASNSELFLRIKGLLNKPAIEAGLSLPF